MTNDIMTTREVAALIINLRDIAGMVRQAGDNAMLIGDFEGDSDSPISLCDPARLQSIANDLYRYAQRLITLIPDDVVVIENDNAEQNQ